MAAPSHGADGFLVNGTGSHETVVVVRAEEALIVALVLALWGAAIALFFNRWGKIRMLEPYQPKFIQQHRSSCPLVDSTLVQHCSFSKFNLNADAQKVSRPGQNSVHTGFSMVNLPANTPRKVKSAFDLQHLVVSEPLLHGGVAGSGGRIVSRDGIEPPRHPRRQSLLVVSCRRPMSSASHEKERRFSFKDLLDVESISKDNKGIDHLNDRNFTPTNESFTKAPRAGNNKPRVSPCERVPLKNGRRNSIAHLDAKPGRMTRAERRYSLWPAPWTSTADTREPEPNVPRTEVKERATAGFRRNSALPLKCHENFEKASWMPREAIKSGVVDFRRNSMLIINHLAEDIGCKVFAADFSAGGSTVALSAPDALAAAKKECMAPASAPDTKSAVASARGKGPKLGIRQPAQCKRVCGAPSKSLDFGAPEHRLRADATAGLRGSRLAISTASLNVSSPGKQVRGNVAKNRTLIVDDASTFASTMSKRQSVPTVSITTSLNDLILASSGVAL